MAAAKKTKKVQKSVYFDEDVMKALEKQMKASHNSNFSAIVNDGLRYAMFPEFRNDRDADLVKLYNQLSYSLAEHRKKTARDMAFIQEIVLQSMKNFYLHHGAIAEDDLEALQAEANARLDKFMEGIVRGMSDLKPLSDREGK